MGKSGRVQKKYRQHSCHQLTMYDSANEKTNLDSECIDVITPLVSDNKPYSKQSTDDSQDCTPKLVLLESKKMGHCNDMSSPKMNTRLPKLKLNLDVPENDDIDDAEDEKSNTIREKDDLENSKDFEKTLSVDEFFESDNEENTRSTLKANDLKKCFSLDLKTDSGLGNVPRKELTSLSGYFHIPSSTFNLPVPVEASSKNHIFTSGSVRIHSQIFNSLLNNPSHFNENQLVKVNSTIRDDCLLSDKKCHRRSFTKECGIKLNGDEKLKSTNPKTVLNIYEDKSWDSTLEDIACINLPVVSDVDSKTIEAETPMMTVLISASEIAVLTSEKYNCIYSKNAKATFIKIGTFCKRLARQCIVWIKKGCEVIKNLLSVIVTASNSPSLVNSEMTRVIATVKRENDRILSVFSEKISSLSQELTEVRLSSEANLQALKDEMNKVQTSNIQLTETTDNLFKEFKILQEKVQEIKSISILVPAETTKSSIPVTPPSLLVPPRARTPGFGVPPLPPPPPPPPSPPPATLLNSKLNYTDTPNNRFNNNTSVKKYSSTPLTGRPVITVEDLLKVTLRKAPQNFKATENRRNTAAGPRGPVISLDMLRDVKLKSARRRSLDQHKSPRSTSRLTKNRSQLNTNLSPHASHAENSLSRLLKSTDANKRVFKKTQSVSSSSENDSSRKASPTKWVVPFCSSDSILN